MSYRILLIALLGLMTSACAPYYESGGYYRSDYYSTDRYVSPGYYRYDRYYVTPQPRYYYQPAPRYYHRSAPAPQYRPYPQPGMQQWHGNPRNDYGNRQRQDGMCRALSLRSLVGVMMGQHFLISQHRENHHYSQRDE